ncbi:serine/threonine protein kinase [Geodermatophilus marinus]|nr:serine/threonine protein kinase [Geodermatophilus sp. LHW52908]
MAAQPPAPDRTLAGRYTLRDVVGRGGMGVVWTATDRLLDRTVAVKEVTFGVHLDDGERRVLRERTLREARTAARIDHPCVTHVLDVVEEDGRPWLVLEYVPSRSLQQLVDEGGPIAWDVAARIGLDVLAGLEAAHAAGIVHRDVKPANVLVCPDGRALLTDFGIATATGESSITTTGAIIGSPSYMAPERAHGGRPGPPADLWSLGATLYTAVEGRPAFSRPEPMATLMAVVSEPPAPVARAGPLEPVLRGLLAKDPAERPTPAGLRDQLQAVLAGRSPAPLRPPPPAPAGAPAPHPVARDGERVQRFDAADLATLASASVQALGTVARDARDQVHHLAERHRERRAGRGPRPEDGARTASRRDASPEPTHRWRFKRRWIVVPTLVVIVVLLAVAAGLFLLAASELGWL